MDFVIIDKDETEFDLREVGINKPGLKYFWRLNALKFRNSIRKRYGRSGGIAIGDKKIDPRNIIFSWTQADETPDEYRTYINSLVGFFDPVKAPFYLIDKENDLRSEVEITQIDDRPKSGGLEQIVGANQISLIMLDPFFEDLDLITFSGPTGGLDSDNSIEIINDGFRTAYPIFYLQTDVFNPDFVFINETNNQSFRMGSNSFALGVSFEINSVDGTVYLDDGISRVESSVALADGSGFINLARGSNIIKYVSDYGSIYVDVKFRRRYGI